MLRDLYVRGKFRDVILPMAVLRRLDAVLEHGKAAVIDMKETLDKAGVVEQDAMLRQAAGQALCARSQRSNVRSRNCVRGYSPLMNTEIARSPIS